MKSFPIGGVHPPENKISSSSAIEVMPTPSVVSIALSQHIGVPANAVVKKGDHVLAGQLIGEANGFMSANVHSSVSGVVKSVDMVINASGIAQPMVTITSDAEQVWCEGIITPPQVIKECPLESSEILSRIKEAGIVGMGGATFPTHVKLSIPPGKRAEFLVINGVECEPYLTSDHRTMLERGEEILVGVEILMRAIGVEKAYIGIENNKPDAIAKLTTLSSTLRGIEVVPL
ncbi:MAG: RnfABCDGE type electron transport complex subunit C, partial [Rikenellaceae bacterium]